MSLTGHKIDISILLFRLNLLKLSYIGKTPQPPKNGKKYFFKDLENGLTFYYNIWVHSLKHFFPTTKNTSHLLISILEKANFLAPDGAHLAFT